MSHNARSSHVFNTRYSLTIKMHHKKYHWMGIVQAIIPRLQIELTIGELVPLQNHAGLRGWTRTGRPYPAFHENRKSSTCGFDFIDYGMPEGSRPGPVNRHGFEIAGWAGARLVPIMGLVPAGWPLGGWRPAPRKRKNGGRRDSRCPKGAGGGCSYSFVNWEMLSVRPNRGMLTPGHSAGGLQSARCVSARLRKAPCLA